MVTYICRYRGCTEVGENVWRGMRGPRRLAVQVCDDHRDLLDKAAAQRDMKIMVGFPENIPEIWIVPVLAMGGRL